MPSCQCDQADTPNNTQQYQIMTRVRTYKGSNVKTLHWWRIQDIDNNATCIEKIHQETYQLLG